MSNDPIAFRLASLPERDRYIAQAQMARAEAMADAIVYVVGKVGGGVKSAMAAVRAWNDARTRQWPHPQALR